MIRYYVLDENHVSHQVDLMEWAAWFGGGGDHRRVARTEIGDAVVSTVFIGLDHNYLGDGPPLIFESMVFDGDCHTEGCDRYSTWAQAMLGHARMVEEVRQRVRAGAGT